MTEESGVLEKIKSRGFWKIEIKPTKYKEKRLSLRDCKEMIKKCQVQNRGWYYPDISDKTDEFFVGNNYAEGLCDWQEHIEVWRLYQSSQFIHYLSLWEDGLTDHRDLFGNPTQNSNISAGTILEPIMTLYTLTEVFLFTSRLASNNVFDDSVSISITLHNTNGRIVKFLQGLRDTNRDYKCKIDSISIQRTITKEDIIKNHAEMALDATIEILERFNWHSDTLKQTFAKDQEDFFKKRF